MYILTLQFVSFQLAHIVHIKHAIVKVISDALLSSYSSYFTSIVVHLIQLIFNFLHLLDEIRCVEDIFI